MAVLPCTQDGIAGSLTSRSDDTGDLEMGVAEWRARGLPAEQGSKADRWGASYDLQFRILFVRWVGLTNEMTCLSAQPASQQLARWVLTAVVAACASVCWHF